MLLSIKLATQFWLQIKHLLLCSLLMSMGICALATSSSELLLIQQDFRLCGNLTIPQQLPIRGALKTEACPWAIRQVMQHSARTLVGMSWSSSTVNPRLVVMALRSLPSPIQSPLVPRPALLSQQQAHRTAPGLHSSHRQACNQVHLMVQQL